MDFGPFAILSLFYAVIGIRVVVRLARSWSETWDNRFTQRDRGLVDESAFFVMVPISVALHELGHAVAIWAFGGEVVEFGYYGFAGFVSYIPFQFTLAERTIIAAAGSIVNLLLCALSLLAVFGPVPKLRAPFNELLLQFAFLSGANAFIVYPLLDIASGLNGDWRQMYDGGVPWLTGVIVAVQAGILLAGYWIYATPAMRARGARLTDVPPGFERGLMGGIRPGKLDLGTLSPAERTLRDAAERVAGGWPGTVTTGLQRFDRGTAVTLQWAGGSAPHVVAVRMTRDGRIDILSIPVDDGGGQGTPRLLHGWPSIPPVDQLTLGLRLAMESVDRGTAASG